MRRPQDSQRRFQTVLRRFIGVFARPEHPLALFLDDLQWLDAATLDLLEGRVEMIRKEITKTDSEYDVEKLQERLAKLAGGKGKVAMLAAASSAAGMLA